jgi:hypothetical protein
MPKFLVAAQFPDNWAPPEDFEAMARDIHALNREMIAAGVRVFAGGLLPASQAKTLRAQPGGGVLITDGPYMEAKEHVGGISILECSDMDEAVAWARKGVIAGGLPVEVREIFFRPAPEE